jgi:hypothetical protein
VVIGIRAIITPCFSQIEVNVDPFSNEPGKKLGVEDDAMRPRVEANGRAGCSQCGRGLNPARSNDATPLLLVSSVQGFFLPSSSEGLQMIDSFRIFHCSIVPLVM